MAYQVHLNSIDEDNRKFVPDEVFETEEDARNVIVDLIECYQTNHGPFVYPICLSTDENIGYIQAILTDDGWEIGYHIAKKYTNQGYATEAIKLFVPFIMIKLNISSILGICHEENLASRKVLEKCGFHLIYQGIDYYQGRKQYVYKYLYQKEM
jgi:RimJ/RimL family protein N-acetyltransferase